MHQKAIFFPRFLILDAKKKEMGICLLNSLFNDVLFDN